MKDKIIGREKTYDEAEIHKASKRDYMQKEQENLAYRQREKRMRLAGLDHDTDMEQTEKFENCETFKGQFYKRNEYELLTS